MPRLLLHSALLAMAAAGCAGVRVVDDHLSDDATYLARESAADNPRTLFYDDDEQVTLSVLFDGGVAHDERLMVEWLLPDGRLYMRRPARGEAGSREVLVTSMAIRDEPPARHEGFWRVRLFLEGEPLLEREFEIRRRGKQARGAPSSTELFTRALACRDLPGAGAARARQGDFDPGPWAGERILDRDDALYAGPVLLSSAGCVPSATQTGSAAAGLGPPE